MRRCRARPSSSARSRSATIIIWATIIRYPAEAKIGANCLIATKALVPIDGPVRENVGLLGSPCFEIPRAADRDRQMSKMDDATRRQRLRAKNRYNFVTAVLFLLKQLVPVLCHDALCRRCACCIILATAWRRSSPLRPSLSSSRSFGAGSWNGPSLGFGRLTPQIALVLDEYYWFHERHWKLFGL